LIGAIAAEQNRKSLALQPAATKEAPQATAGRHWGRDRIRSSEGLTRTVSRRCSRTALQGARGARGKRPAEAEVPLVSGGGAGEEGGATALGTGEGRPATFPFAWVRGRAGRWAGGGGELALRNDHNALG